MVTFSILNSKGLPAPGVSITISVPGEKKMTKRTDEHGAVSFDTEADRGGIHINGRPWYYGSLDVDVFQLPYP